MVWANAFVMGLGGALVTLPVILHFLMQPKPKILEFPALKFVKKRQFTNTNSTRLRHILLLLLRCLLLLCMAAALAGPSVASRVFGQWIIVAAVGLLALVVLFSLLTVVFKSEKLNVPVVAILGGLLAGLVMYGGWASYKLLESDSTQLIGDSSAPVSAILLIDNSCRMQYEQENKTNLQRAREIGHWLIGQFPSESQVCVLPTNDDLPFYSVDLGAADKRIEGLETSYLNSPIPSRISESLRLLDDAVHERKEIYVITDLSQKSWEGTQSTIASQLKVKNSVSVFVVDVGFDDIQNFTLTPLSLSTQHITTGGSIEVATSISRLGSRAKRNVRFRMERPDNTRPVLRDGQVLLPEKFIERVKTLDVQPLAENRVEFQFSESLPLGIHHGTVEIVGEDALTVDDRQHFSIEVVESWRLLVVHGRGVPPENFTLSIVDDADANLYDLTVVEQSKMPASFEEYDSVVFLDPDRGISDTTWGTIQKYVASGHGVGFFLGAGAADGGYAHNTFQSEAAQTVFSGKLNRQWRRPSADLFLSPDNLNHPIFEPFRTWETAVPWNRFPIFYHWGIVPDDKGAELPTKTLLRYSNGKPAIIERQIGDGIVMVMTTPITDADLYDNRDSWNSLFVGRSLPAWLLVRQMNQQLVQSQADRLNVKIGEFVRLNNDFRKYPEKYTIFTPRTSQSTEKVTATEGSVRYRFTDSPGQYRLRGNFEGPLNRGFSVNLQQGQTDLTRIEPAALDAVFGAERYQLARKKDEIQRQQGTQRRGQEFYPLLLLLLVIVLGMEHLLANRFYS